MDSHSRPNRRMIQYFDSNQSQPTLAAHVFCRGMEVAFPAESTADAVMSAVDTTAASPDMVLLDIKAAAASSGSAIDLSAVAITEMTAPVLRPQRRAGVEQWQSIMYFSIVF